MPVDPRIAMGYQAPQIESPLNQFAKFQQIESNQRVNQLAQMQMAEYERGLKEQEGLRNYLAGGADITSPDTLKGLYGFGKTGLEMAQKAMAIKKEEMESSKSQEELLSKIRDRYLSNIGSAQSFKELANVHQSMFNDPVLRNSLKQSGRDVDVGLKAILEAQNSPDPVTAFRDLQLEMQGGVEKYLSTTKPTVIQQGNRLVSVDPVSGRVTVVPGSEYETPITPFQQQSLALQERLAGQGVTYQTDANGNIIALPTRQTLGTTPAAKVVAGEGGTPVQAKLTPLAEQTKAKREQLVRDIDTAVSELKDAISPGGLLEKSTASGAGKMIDTAAAFFGKSTEGAQAAAALKPIADVVLKLVPRFEGPQSDKDTKSYKEAAGELANESLPVATRKKAAETIIRLMSNRKNQFGSKSMSSEEISADGNTPAKPKPTERSITRTGTINGRKVVQYSNGDVEYAD
jgi:hypothetical protein